MKKVLLVLVLVAAYGISMANVSTKVTVEKSQMTIVADSDDFSAATEEEEKDKKKNKKEETKKACCSGTADAAKSTTATKAVGEKPSTGCTDAQKKSCAASGKTCGDAKATTEKKSSCCSEKKK